MTKTATMINHPALVPYKSRLEATAKPCNEILLAPQEADLPPWAGKVGGMPYLPAGSQWPLGEGGAPLVFLAQLNFADMPPLPDFPTQGIVQFFIGDDDFYGANFSDEPTEIALTKPKNFRVLYHESIVHDEAQLLLPEAIVLGEFTPHDAALCCAISFTTRVDVVSATDGGLDNILGADIFDIIDGYAQQRKADPDRVGEAVFAELDGAGHKVGGYPGFTQQDPRAEDTDYVLLFQLDSDDDAGIMWGDVGIGNFFIRKADLVNRDFSKVLYTWDCC